MEDQEKGVEMTDYKPGQRVRIVIEGTVGPMYGENITSEGDSIEVRTEHGSVFVEVDNKLKPFVEVIPEPLPTEPGIYAHRGAVLSASFPMILKLDEDGEWHELTKSAQAFPPTTARNSAELWHRLGELVELVVAP